ncbi:hypothetical protein ACB094_01G282000 [Castanea mollissima]
MARQTINGYKQQLGFLWFSSLPCSFTNTFSHLIGHSPASQLSNCKLFYFMDQQSSAPNSVKFEDGSFVRIILSSQPSNIYQDQENADEAEYSLDLVPGMPTRYSYADLQAITKQFNKELGHGGFGTVFKGTLFDGTTVAVKRLDGFSQIKKSFLAEVKTIGSVHHFNLLEEAMHLFHLFTKKIVEDQLLDLIDTYDEDMQLHRAKVVNMMRVAAWCLRHEFTKRPSKSMVVKVLEGDVNVESDLDYYFLNPTLPSMRTRVDNQEENLVVVTPLLPSVLLRPR